MLDVVAIILQHTEQYNDGMPYSSVGRAIPVGDQRFFVTIIITGGDTLAE